MVVWVLQFREDYSVQSRDGVVGGKQSVSHNQPRAEDPTVLRVNPPMSKSSNPRMQEATALLNVLKSGHTDGLVPSERNLGIRV